MLQVFLFLLLLLSGSIIYYFFHRKRRKKAFYSKSDPFWRDKEPDTASQKHYSVFLIGDAGAPSLLHPEPTLVLLRQHLLSADEKSAIFFLGDNIYPRGFPEPNHPLHEVAEKRLLTQLETLQGYKGRICFISGNHDWNKGRKGGYEAMMRQQTYIESYFGKEDVYLPRNGCPGPVELNINELLTIVVINTQWWVHGGKKPSGRKDGCSVDNEHEFYTKLQAILEKNRMKKILVIGHHPVYSKAYHGGKFDLKQHLFPLTSLNKRMYLPLPVAGSLYPIYRKYIGSKEDMAHPKYRNMRRRLINIFNKYDNLIYAAGHDHNLQYIKKGRQHYIISGAGCKVNYVQKGSGAYFTHAHKGFFRLDYYKNGRIWVEAWEPKYDNDSGILAYKKELHQEESEVGRK
jgi:calcineurin-like phosphoesterase family protein